MGPTGPTGLSYEAAYPLIERATTSPQEWDELLDDLQTLERAALEVIHEKD